MVDKIAGCVMFRLTINFVGETVGNVVDVVVVVLPFLTPQLCSSLLGVHLLNSTRRIVNPTATLVYYICERPHSCRKTLLLLFWMM